MQWCTDDDRTGISIKRSLDTDKFHLSWVDVYLKDKKLSEIDDDLLEGIAKEKEKEGIVQLLIGY